MNLLAVATELDLTGCLDLPGRGYSSAPSPDFHPQSSTFFINVILYVLASSPLAWTGSSSFAAVGYSLGGGVIVDFASHFGGLISSVVLLAPSGLIRPYHFGWQSGLLYSCSLLPEWIRETLVSRRLRSSDDSDQQRSESSVEEKLPSAEEVDLSSDDERQLDIAKVVVSQPT